MFSGSDDLVKEQEAIYWEAWNETRPSLPCNRPPGDLQQWFSEGFVVTSRCCGQQWMGQTSLGLCKGLWLCWTPRSLSTCLLSGGTRCPRFRVRPQLYQRSRKCASENWESPILQVWKWRNPCPQMGESSRAGRQMGAPTYRELMRLSAFREWVSQRSVKASSSARSCSQVSLLGAPIKPTDKGNKDMVFII